ncbi:hypothetical protein L9F63_016559 [Diploptera punctata]|uniref:Mos1 transposase HTH domain-containing protein n=1 Tax=Diploptera punctata TaxID=6984 RepID=A0AAD8EHE7_DIPPU|nr:hypothetical protein L9F63_016559 [Diploptera punctata]
MLQSSTCEEQRSVVRFLWAKGHKPSEIHRDMRGVYGDDCMDRSNVFRKVSARWVPKNLTDDHKGQRMMASLDHLTRYTRHKDMTFWKESSKVMSRGRTTTRPKQSRHQQCADGYTPTKRTSTNRAY